MRSFASSLTFSHSGAGKSNWPRWMRLNKLSWQSLQARPETSYNVSNCNRYNYKIDSNSKMSFRSVKYVLSSRKVSNMLAKTGKMKKKKQPTLIPATVLTPAFSIKWWITTYHDVNNNAKWPHITTLVVFKCITNESIHYLNLQVRVAMWEIRLP